MQIVVLGAGALGSLFAGRLAASDADVTLLGRASEHFERVATAGLELTHPDGSDETVAVETATDPDVVADADALIVCVKSYDTDGAVASVANYLSDTDVLTLQNGLGNADSIADHVPDEHVIAGTTTHGATVESAGHVRHAGMGDTTIGQYFAPNDDAVDSLAGVLTDAGIETTVTDDPEKAVWTKVLVNAGINATTALARVPNGALVEDEAGERVLRRAVVEGLEIARAEGVDVPEDVVERTRDVAERTASNRSSMRQDVEAGRRTEIEALNGELARRADAHGIDASVNETLADLTRLAEKRDADE